MEFNHSIPKTKHIHKTIPSLLFTAALLLCTALITPYSCHPKVRCLTKSAHPSKTLQTPVS